MKKILLSVCTLVSIVLHAQFQFYPANNIPVYEGSKKLLNPWCGGLNSPIFSSIDFNNDSLLDFMLFDHEGGVVLTFVNSGKHTADSAWFYYPKYETAFPPLLYHDWALMRDVDRDGIYDLLTDTTAGFSFWHASLTGDTMSFTLKQDIVKSFSGVAWPNLYVSNADLPALDDIDADGDLDVVTFNLFGQTLDYHENRQIEDGFPADTMVFNFVTQCWGLMGEDGVTNTIYLGLSCKDGSATPADEVIGEARHTGGTITTFDFEKDLDKEAVIGDVTYSNLIYTRNGGDTSFANMTGKDTNYPRYDLPVHVPYFPAASFLDANNDSLLDMMVSPYASASSINNGSVLYYQGTDDSLVLLEFQTDSFLQEQMIELGESSHPVFFDYNGDTLMDLLVGSYGNYDVGSGLYSPEFVLYQNIGALDSPAYRMVTRNYEGIASLGLYGISATFGDIDNDGDDDMLIGEEAGKLYLFTNVPVSGIAHFTLTGSDYFGIDVGQHSKPCWYDFDADGDLDLVVGRKDGHISYYWNFGTAAAALYAIDSVNTLFAHASVGDSYYPDGMAAPVVTELNDGVSSKTYLVVGGFLGWLWVYDIDTDSLRSGSFPVVTNSAANIQDGFQAHPAFADINNDGFTDLVLGNIRGGVQLYSQTIIDSFKIFHGYNPNIPCDTCSDTTDNIGWNENSLLIYPNPAQDEIVVAAQAILAGTIITLQNSVGQVVLRKTVVETTEMVHLNLNQLSPGVYHLVMKNKGIHASRKVVIY